MKQAAAPKQASKIDSSRRTELPAGSRGIALVPPDYGIDLVDHLSASDGPIRLNGSPGALRQKTLFDGSSNSPRVMQQTVDPIANSPRVLQQKAFSDSVRNSPQVIAQRQRMEGLFGAPVQRRDMEELPGEPGTAQRVMAEATVSRRASSPGSPAPLAAPGSKPNGTGLPDGLKSGVESLSGQSLDDVKVHYNSSRPAQLDALAYAQGRDIHIAPGQERHLPHEAWHVVQQAQGRVQPTMQLQGGIPVNDDAGLEREADEMGPKSDDPIAGGSQDRRRTDNIVQRVPVGRYKAAPPSVASGTKWDSKDTGYHKSAKVPMHLIAVMRDPTNGGVPTVDPPGWNWLKKKFGRLKGQWVRFHIINAQLGGSGKDEENLVPTMHILNHDRGWRKVEEDAKDSASTNHKWTYLEVQLTYDHDFPKGIPQKIVGEWGAWSSSKGWEQQGVSGTLKQSNPKYDTSGDFLPPTQITLDMLKGWGLSVDQARVAKDLIGRDWKNQVEFEYAWADEHKKFGHGDLLVDKIDVQSRMYVDEDDAQRGPYPVIVKTA